MASLFSMLAKGKRAYSAPLDKSVVTARFARLESHPPHLVNVQPILDAIQGEPVRDISWDATPCHPDLWLEWMLPDSRRLAFAITRFGLSDVLPQIGIPERARFLLEISYFVENEAQAHLFSDWFVFIDEFGEFLFDSLLVFHDPAKEQEFGFNNTSAGLFEKLILYAAEILTVMNTRGTRIEPPLEKHCEIVKPNRRPHSVWHTIHLPKFQNPPLENAVIDGPVLERREHWVRAHRKDYRKGAGMFGRVKALVWVPEFQRGNPELGTVKQSFTVEAKQA